LVWPTHFPLAASQLAEQQSVLVVHALPVVVHATELSGLREPSMIASTKLPPPPSSTAPSPPSASGEMSALSLPHPVDPFITAAVEKRTARKGHRSLVMPSTLPLPVSP
jgi:hypothetical protein